MNDQVRVSAIVIVRNGELYLHQALTSIHMQTHPIYETILVDGNSTDATLDIAHDFGVRIVMQTGTGIADARNLGIAHAQGDYIAFLDHDDYWHVDKVAKQMELHRSMPSIAYSLTHLMFFRDNDAPLPPNITANNLNVPRAAGTPSVLVAQRKLFDKIGGFNTRYKIACDAEWFTRARNASVPTSIIPEVLTYKRLHNHNASRDIALNRQEMFAVARESIMRHRKS